MELWCDLSDAFHYKVKDVDFIYSLGGSPEWEKLDCAVRALAIVTDFPYRLIHEMCKAWGRKDKGSTLTGSKFIKWLPFKWTRFVRKPVRLETFIKKHPVGNFYVQLSDHVTAVCDGVVIDAAIITLGRIVFSAWRFEGMKKQVYGMDN